MRPLIKYMPKLHKATFEKILKEADKNIRVSDSSAEAMIEIIGTISGKIARDAAELAKHAGRKTVMGDDIKLACKKLGFLEE